MVKAGTPNRFPREASCRRANFKTIQHKLAALLSHSAKTHLFPEL